MASKLKVAAIPSLVGGLNNYVNPTQVNDNESPDSQNFIPTGLTAIKKRQGFQKLITSQVVADHKIQGIFSYITDSTREILYVSNGVLYKYNGTTGSAQVTGGTLNASNRVNAAQIGSRLYLVDGVTALQYYDGTNIVTTGIASAPTAVDQLIVWNNRLYCTSRDVRSRVYYGGALTSTGGADNTGNFASTTPAFAGFFTFSIGKEVVGFAKIGTSLYCFLKNCIYKLDTVASTGTTDALDHSATIISSSIGCRAPRSIDNVDNDIFFLDDTVYSLGEVATYATIRTRNVSAKVKALFTSMTLSAIEDAAAIYYDKDEMFLVSMEANSGYNDTVIGYSVPYKAWFKWTGLSVNSWLDYIDANNIKHLYFASDNPAKSYVYEMFQTLNDDGVAISAYHKLKQFDLKMFNIEKIFQNWNMEFGGVYGNVTVDFYVDGALADTVMFASGQGLATSDGIGTLPTGTFNVGEEGNFTTTTSIGATLNNDWRWHTLQTHPVGTTFQPVISNNNLNESVEVKQMSVGYIPLPYYKRESIRKV